MMMVFKHLLLVGGGVVVVVIVIVGYLYTGGSASVLLYSMVKNFKYSEKQESIQ